MIDRPGRLGSLADDRLGTLAVAAVLSELRTFPDVGPAVAERLARDAVAYPEQLSRAPEPASVAPSGGTSSPVRRLRLALIAALGLAIGLVFAGALLLPGGDRALGATADLGGISIELEPVASGFDQPLFVTASGDGSGDLFVVEQPGRIRVLKADGSVVDDPYLDLSDAVVLGYEQGLLGLAFHPDFATNGRFFVNYTRRGDGATVVSELRASDGAAERSSERIILTIEQPYENHNGGHIAFDADGYLLVGMGDGGGGEDPHGFAQDPASLLGKLLRLDVDAAEPYGIPPDNGFLGDAAYRPEIHASGLRNPWRFSVDPVGGHIYIGDVGQGSWEEIDALEGGRGGVSLGWNELEGPQCFNGLCDPAAHLGPAIAYAHDPGCTVIGGYAYRGTRQPLLAGTYLFGDYCSGTIWGASADQMLEGPTDATELGRLEGTLVSFGSDDTGELYTVDQAGRVLHIVAGPVDQAAGRSALLAAEVEASPEETAAASPPAPGAATSPAAGFDAAAVAIRTELVVEGLDQPVTVTGDGTGSGRLYIVERGGIIRIVEGGRVRGVPLLDISDLVNTTGELGMHAVAFHPDFSRNGRFFVHYNDLKGRTRVDEFRVDGPLPAEPRPSRRILQVEQPYINNNGGPIAFGPDGYLYVALGDGGGSSPGDPEGYGQRKDTLLAKVLRLDVDGGKSYTVPKSNPFAKGKKRRVFAPETWVWGLRNPSGAGFDRTTGDLWIADVGQDSYEEIDLVRAGESGLNFGWSDMEGERCHLRPDCVPSDYAAPVHVYDRAPPNCGVVGGYPYRGAAIPALQGAYLFTDLCSGIIWALDADAARQGIDVPVVQLLDAPQGWRSFGEDDDGELYVTSLDGGIYRIEAEDTG